MKNVYIIEDEKTLRDLLCTFFETSFPEIEIVGMTGDGSEGIEQCLELKPDLVVVDVQLPEVNGLEILHALKRKSPETKILLFTGDTSNQTLKSALKGEADGFIDKVSRLEELEKAIRALAKGERYYGPEIHEKIVRIRSGESAL